MLYGERQRIWDQAENRRHAQKALLEWLVSGRVARAMPQQRRSSTARDQLSRVINPLDLVVITRERLQEVLDEAVERGRITRDDAADLVSDVLARGRSQAEDLLAELEQLLGRAPIEAARRVDRARAGVPDHRLRRPDRRRGRGASSTA